MITSFAELPVVLSATDVAEILNVSFPTVYEMLHRGEIYIVKIGRTYKIPKDAVMEYLHIDNSTVWGDVS